MTVETATRNVGRFVTVGPATSIGPAAKAGGRAQILGTARLSGSVVIAGRAAILDDVEVSDNAVVDGNAVLSDTTDVGDNAYVGGNAEVSLGSLVGGGARVCGNARLIDAFVYGHVSGAAVIDRGVVESTGIVVGKSFVGEKTRVGGIVCGNAKVVGHGYSLTTVGQTGIVGGDAYVGKGSRINGTVGGRAELRMVNVAAGAKICPANPLVIDGGHFGPGAIIESAADVFLFGAVGVKFGSFYRLGNGWAVSLFDASSNRSEHRRDFGSLDEAAGHARKLMGYDKQSESQFDRWVRQR